MKRAAIALLVTLSAFAQEPADAPGRYVGVASCANGGCHGATQPLSATHVLQNEYFTWLNSDRHAGAYNVLFSDRSARIARNMRVKGKAYESNVCLDCHTTNVPASLVSGTVDAEDGVQCEVCHGPASGWRAQHAEEGWTHEQSVAHGMIDLRNVMTRGSVCVQCHVGSAKKEVDHELIASGHPVLAFELDNYTESMPPHWTPSRDTHGVRAWATGQLVKFNQSLENLSRHARGEKWPEFADMSCANCHHSLKGSQWRQERGWPDRAGLPAWSPQHWAMIRLIIGRVSPSARNDLDPLVTQIARSVARMSDPAAVASNADRARKIAEGLVTKVDSARWSDTDVRAFMATVAADHPPDVLTAQQTALALQSLNSSLTRRDPRLLRGSLTKSIDALFDALQSPDDFDPARFDSLLAAIRGAL